MKDHDICRTGDWESKLTAIAIFLSRPARPFMLLTDHSSCQPPRSGFIEYDTWVNSGAADRFQDTGASEIKTSLDFGLGIALSILVR
jgi:hypothetical protein